MLQETCKHKVMSLEETFRANPGAFLVSSPDQLRPHQIEVANLLLRRESVAAVLPTGSGKSLIPVIVALQFQVCCLYCMGIVAVIGTDGGGGSFSVILLAFLFPIHLRCVLRLPPSRPNS